MSLQKNRDPRVVASSDPATRRLTNIRPREVSLVDAAANGREFLIIKRKDAMAKKDKNLFKNANSNENAVTDNPAEGAEQAGEKPAENQKNEGDNSTVDVEIQKVFTSQVENDLKDVPLMKALASEQKDMFLAMSQALVSMAGSMDMIRSDLMSFANTDGGTGFLGAEVEKVEDNVRKQLEGVEDGVSDQTLGLLVDIVEKKGRKMRKTRLEKLKNIMSNLSNLVKELETESSSGSANGGARVSKDEQGSEGTQQNESVNKNENAGSTDQVVEKSAEQKTAEIVEAAVTKAVKPLQERLDKLEGTPNTSTSENADNTEEITKNAANKEESIFKGVIY